MPRRSVLLVLLLSFLAASGLPLCPLQAAERLALLPAEFSLSTPRSVQRVLLQRLNDEGFRGQVAEQVSWSTSDPKVATVKNGFVRPLADGDAVITATHDGREAHATVRVTGMEQTFRWSFRNHVQPVFAKLGCNSGACHGALAGKGGFRLSLRGYDPEADYFNVVQQDRGRRVELADPGRSLVLAKPSGAIRHKGGVRFETDSHAYEVISQWIADGAKPPAAEDPVVEELRVLPDSSVQSVSDRQQMVVQAVYSDGRVEDVTQWVKWSSSNQAVCQVDGAGQVTMNGPGEGAVVAWFASRLAIARVTVPFENADDAGDAKVDDREPRNFIDEHVDSQLARLNLPASPGCTDAEFIRRAFVDTIGVLPTTVEVREFLSDDDPKKRDKLIDQLLERPEFVDYWTYKWCDILMLNGTLLRPDALKAYYQWVRGHVEKNSPWDQLVHEIVTSTGESVENGATNFFALHQTPEDMTENACQAFMGLSIGCAKCHNHPLEKWTNDQYYAVANLFSRVKAKGWGGEPRSGDGRRTLYVVSSGELVQPRTGKPQPPTPLDGKPLSFDDPNDRRAYFADWLTSPENPYFARAITNRVWANFFAVGLVESVDDMRVSNPASNEGLLQAAADYVVEKKFDLKPLMKTILQSNAWQRSSRPLPGNRTETRFYSRYYPRRMMAEVLHDAIVQVTRVPSKFEWVAFPGADRQKTDFYPIGTRAIQLYDSAVESYFLQTFGRNQRRIVCECERSSEPSMVQVLHISNGKTVNDKLKAADNRIGTLLRLRRQGMSDAALLDEIYLTCLARYPTGTERDRLTSLLPAAGSSDERQVVEDLFWGVMSSREFLFNH